MKLSLKNWQAIVSAIALAAATANATDLVWIGGTGNWNAAGNWSPAQVPTAADSAWITNNGTYTVTLPAGTTATSGSLTVGGASGTQTLAIDRATLTLNGASVVKPNAQLTLLVAQSVLNGAGNLTVNGTLNWADGTMAGTGVTAISSGGVLAIGSRGGHTRQDVKQRRQRDLGRRQPDHDGQRLRFQQPGWRHVRHHR